jgi:hypothetical protein
MYDIGDDDLAKSYDPKKVAAGTRTPKLPDVEVQYDAILKRVSKQRAPKAGNLYEFKFQITRSSSELVPEGATYTLAYFPGSSDVDFNMFWEKVTPLLMAVNGATNVVTFNAAEALGELMGLSKGTPATATAPAVEGVDLDLAFRGQRALEPCKPNKEGVIKHKNADGSPKIFPRDTFLVASAAQQAAQQQAA